MGALGLTWRVHLPPPGWRLFVAVGVIGSDGGDREVVFQPDRWGRVPAVACGIGFRQATPALMTAIEAAARAVTLRDLPRRDGYGRRGGPLRRQLCLAIAERLNRGGERPVVTGLPSGFLLSDDEAAAMRAQVVR